MLKKMVLNISERIADDFTAGISAKNPFQPSVHQKEINTSSSKNGFRKITCIYCLLFLTIFFNTHINAKTATTHNSTAFRDISSFRIADFEKKMRVFFERKLLNTQKRPRKMSAHPVDPPDDYDRLILARTWNSLSPAFKKLYAQSAQIPDSFSVFASPGGNFEIYYTINGLNGVSPDDTYMFDVSNWRSKIILPNGIPDLVDEVAWAFDSTWSMEIDRFKFNQPYPYKTPTHNSDKFKVVIARPDNSDEYGFTMIKERVQKNGFSCFITIRNDWSQFNTEPLRYDTNPLPAIRVTCAHEFFHAIQYSMSWDVGDNTQLDNFPLSWIESSAVTMEELAFPEVNDYIQYARPFFNYPDMIFFSTSSNLRYSNSLPLIYNSTRNKSGSSIDFIRSMHLRNFQSPALFAANLEQTSQESGSTWPQILNEFQTASFFTGNRADSAIFISDAPYFSEWSYKVNSPTSKRISKNSMAIFSTTHKSTHIDTMFVTLGTKASVAEPLMENSWAASSILRTDQSDTIIPVTLSKTGYGTLTIPQWNTANELLIITTSGFSDTPRNYDIDFISCPVSYLKNSIDTLFLNQSDISMPFVTLHAITNLRCSLTISDTINRVLLDTAELHDLSPVAGLFSVQYPPSWYSDAELLLIKQTPAEDSSVLCLWDSSEKKWLILSDKQPDSIAKATKLTTPGIYGYFNNKKAAIIGSDIVVFPNPIRIRNGLGYVNYEGSSILGVTVYAVDGTLIYKKLHNATQNSLKQRNERFQWDLHNSAGRPITPGVYSILIKYEDNNTFKTVRKKLLLVP